MSRHSIATPGRSSGNGVLRKVPATSVCSWSPNLLIVSVDGYMYGLDPLTGGQLWYNPMTGFGSGVTSLASVRGGSSSQVNIAAAEIAARQASQASSNSAAS